VEEASTQENHSKVNMDIERALSRLVVMDISQVLATHSGECYIYVNFKVVFQE
jgi:hypothetical protein